MNTHRNAPGPTRRTVIAGLAAALLAAPAAAQQQAGRSALPIPGKRSLPQRVICTLGAGLMPRPGAPDGVAQPPLRVLYVYGRQQAPDQLEWLEVGRAPTGGPEGWVRADQAVRWDHNLALTYTPRSTRERVIYVRTRDEIRALVTAPDRAQRVRALYAQAAASTPDQRARAMVVQATAGTPGVVALEPAAPLDPATQFYLLPLLDVEHVTLPNGASATLVEVAAIATRADGAPLVAPQSMSGMPAVTRAWTTHADLSGDNVEAFEVGVLVTRRQLAAFADVVRAILAEARSSTTMRPANFFDRLRGASAVMARDPAQLRSRAAAGFGDTDELIADMPYESVIMAMQTEHYLAFGAANQLALIDRIERILTAHADLAQRRDAWFSAGGTAPADDDLTLLPLDRLP